jgi:hypothetical protein
MRSCEYLKVPQAHLRRTDILKIRNIKFYRNGRLLSHDHPELEYADCVSITFKMQKKDEKVDTVTMYRTEHLFMCPVRAWAAIVKRIRSYPGADENTPVSSVWRLNRIEHITSDEVIKSLGYENLGVEKGDFGTHSIRSGGAMAMYLDEVPIYSIMMIGRWSSDAFLRYIRKQVEQFSHNISKRMNKHMHYRHIPLVDVRIGRNGKLLFSVSIHLVQAPTGIIGIQILGGSIQSCFSFQFRNSIPLLNEEDGLDLSDIVSIECKQIIGIPANDKKCDLTLGGVCSASASKSCMKCLSDKTQFHLPSEAVQKYRELNKQPTIKDAQLKEGENAMDKCYERFELLTGNGKLNVAAEKLKFLSDKCGSVRHKPCLIIPPQKTLESYCILAKALLSILYPPFSSFWRSLMINLIGSRA